MAPQFFGVYVKLIFIVTFIFAASAMADTCAPLLSRDKYQSFAELSRSEIEGVDYHVVIKNVGSDISVIAPHGGKIESGTSEIATAIAGHRWNLYLFNGCKPGDNFCLHVTSTRFDERRAIDLVSRSKFAISIHGFVDKHDLVIVGGLNTHLAYEMAHALQRAGFSVEYPATRFKGESSKNIVNRAEQRGAQIEISSPLRQKLLDQPELLKDFVRAVRTAVLSLNQKTQLTG